MSSDGTLLVSISNDKSIKVFDVANIDMMAMLRLPYVPACAEWVYRVRTHPGCGSQSLLRLCIKGLIHYLRHTLGQHAEIHQPAWPPAPLGCTHGG